MPKGSSRRLSDPANPGKLLFTYTRSKNAVGISWEIESSATLASWSPATFASHTKVSEDAARETWRAGITTVSPGNIYLRLKTAQAP